MHLLDLPGRKFLEAAYRHILKREIDHHGLLHHLERLANGISKQETLIDLMKSPEARNLQDDAREDNDQQKTQLMNELERLKKDSKSPLFARWSTNSSLNRKLNSLEFRLESSIDAMIDQLHDYISQELVHREIVLIEENGKLSNAEVVNAVQARRRAVSRPLGKN